MRQFRYCCFVICYGASELLDVRFGDSPYALLRYCARRTRSTGCCLPEPELLLCVDIHITSRLAEKFPESLIMENWE